MVDDFFFFFFLETDGSLVVVSTLYLRSQMESLNLKIRIIELNRIFLVPQGIRKSYSSMILKRKSAKTSVFVGTIFSENASNGIKLAAIRIQVQTASL